AGSTRLTAGAGAAYDRRRLQPPGDPMKTLRRAAARLGWIGLVCATLGACAMSQEPLRVVSLDAQRVQRAQSQAPALIDRLQQGNQRFVAGEPMRRDAPAMVRATAKGQAPWAAVLSCMDSRAAPELVFDQGVGDLFSVRVAGNVVNDDVLASLEYATQVAGVRLIVVLGHSDCGAVKGACDGVDLGHLQRLLTRMRPALQQTQVAGARN